MTTALLSIEDIHELMDAITSPALTEGRELTEQEVTDYAALETDLTAAQTRRAASDAVKARHENYKAVATKPLHVGPAKPDDAELTAAFTAYLRTGQENADIQQLRAAQSEGVASEGGFTVPEGFRTQLVERMKAFGGLANVVEEYTTETGNNVEWPTLDDTANTGEVVEEGGTFAGGADLVFGSASIGAYSYMAGGAGGLPLRVSRELAQDSAFDIAGLVTRKLGERMARIQATHLVTGTWVKQPQGIVAGRTGIQTIANNAIGYKDLLAYVHALDPAYRASPACRWAFNDSFLQTVRGLLDTNGRPLLNSSLEAGWEHAPVGMTLLGYPVTIDQAFANFTNNSPTVNYGVFGDLAEGYVVRRVRAVELLVNPYSRMANRQIEYSAWARMDAVQQNTSAYIAMTGKA